MRFFNPIVEPFRRVREAYHTYNNDLTKLQAASRHTKKAREDEAHAAEDLAASAQRLVEILETKGNH
jgi:hypothetical protein